MGLASFFGYSETLLGGNEEKLRPNALRTYFGAEAKTNAKLGTVYEASV